MSFVGGQLKLKGNEPLKGAVKKKKKKSSDAKGVVTTDGSSGGGGAAGDAADMAADRKALLQGYSLEGRPTEGIDHRTEAERRHEATMRQREEERLRKLAGKSHRDRIKEFNEHLTNLSEHYDIPKVGPG